MKSSKRADSEQKVKFSRKNLLSGSGALDIALQKEKAKSLLTRQEIKIVNELGLHARPAAESERQTFFAPKFGSLKPKSAFPLKASSKC
jgi:hypothetical protein